MHTIFKFAQPPSKCKQKPQRCDLESSSFLFSLFLGLNVQYHVTKRLNLGLLLESSLCGKGKHHVDIVSGHDMIYVLLKKCADWRTLQISQESTPLHDAFKMDFAAGA